MAVGSRERLHFAHLYGDFLFLSDRVIISCPAPMIPSTRNLARLLVPFSQGAVRNAGE